MSKRHHKKTPRPARKAPAQAPPEEPKGAPPEEQPDTPSIQVDIKGGIFTAAPGEVIEKKARLGTLSQKAEQVYKELESMVREEAEKIAGHYTKELDAIYEGEGVSKIKQLFSDTAVNIPVFNYTIRHAREFEDGFIEICQNCITSLVPSIRETMRDLPEYRKIKECFDGAYQMLLPDLDWLGTIVPSTRPRLSLPDGWFLAKTPGFHFKRSAISADLTDGATDKWDELYAMLTSCSFRIFLNPEQMQEYFISRYDARFRRTFRNTLNSALYGEKAPIGEILAACENFRQACTCHLTECASHLCKEEEAFMKENYPETWAATKKLNRAFGSLS